MNRHPYLSLSSIKERFIQLAFESNALTFGRYVLKSGRISPYFFNAGLIYQGSALKELGYLYAQTWAHHHLGSQQLFGPAYKGLPLATSTAIALSDLGIETTVTFNRKEVKDHGEGGQLIGAPLQGPVVIIDDVITAGTAFREAQTLIAQHGGQLTSIIIALDRCEHGQGQQSAIEEIQSQGIHVYSIATFFDLIEYLTQRNAQDKVDALCRYHNEQG